MSGTIDDRPAPSWLDSPRGRPFRALRVPQFRVIWGSFAVSQLGFWIAFLAFQSIMLDLTDGSSVWLGLLFFANFIPMLVVTAFAGALADRIDRKQILELGFTAIAVLASVLAALSFGGLVTPFMLIPFALGIGTVFALNAPANQALVISSVPSAQISSAISMQSLAGNLCRVIGPAIAGIILTVSSGSFAIAVYAIVSAIVVLYLRRATIVEPQREASTQRYLATLADGFRYARSQRPILPALAVLALSSLSAGAYLGILPVVSDAAFDRGSTGLSLLSMVTGLGSAVGAVLTGALASPSGLRATMVPLVGFGVSFAVFGMAPTWWLALVSVGVVGFFYFWAMTSLNTLVQESTDDAMRGRVMALFVVAWGGIVPIGALWQGVATEIIGVRATIVICGAATALAGVIVLLRGPLSRRPGSVGGNVAPT